MPTVDAGIDVVLINLLLENEEDGMKKVQINTDLAIQPTDIKATLDALDNINNYDGYAQNLRDKNAIRFADEPLFTISPKSLLKIIELMRL